MRQLKRNLGEESMHKGASMVVINVLTHGNKDGHLSAVDGGHGWYIQDLVGTLTDVEALRGKPKIFFFNACRGGKVAFMSLIH